MARMSTTPPKATTTTRAEATDKTKQQQTVLEDTTLGCQLAALAILDDNKERLQNEDFGWWHKHAVEMITNTFDQPQEWKQGLTHVLKTKFQLQTDKIINIHDLTPNRRLIDLQGYIAHNDEMIVISFQGTASLQDNFINADFLTSEWEVETDGPQGYAGNFSAVEGRKLFRNRRVRNIQAPPSLRVHTGFYNNFLAVLPFIQKYVEPLIAHDQPPRKVIVCGHSLGGAIATLAGTYLWQKYDWNSDSIPQRLCVLSMGAPRPCQREMAEYFDQELQKKRMENKNNNSVSFIRVQRNKDAIPHLPLTKMGFEHFPKQATFLTADHHILNLEKEPSDKKGRRKEMAQDSDEAPEPRCLCILPRCRNKRRAIKAEELHSLAVHPSEEDYWQRTQGFPLAIRDHFPTLYLLPFRKECPTSFQG